MLLPALSFLALFIAVHLYRTPGAVLRRYVATFRSRHGFALQVSLAVLGACCFSAAAASFTHPGHAIAELVVSLVLGGLTLLGVLDLRLFRRGTR